MTCPFFSYDYGRCPYFWLLWFRIYGYGLSITNEEARFSERYGHSKSVRLFGIKLEVLTP